jgi:hypothetical protein
MSEKSSKHIGTTFIEKTKPKRGHEPQKRKKDGFKKQEELAKKSPQ